MKRNYSELEAHFEKCIGKYDLPSRQFPCCRVSSSGMVCCDSDYGQANQAKNQSYLF